MKEERDLICIRCPLGCPIHVVLEDGEVTSVTGNTCPRGEAYARKEVTAPTRIVTSTVHVEGGVFPMVSCKTAADVPKERVRDVAAALKDVTAKAPVAIGDVLLPDVCGTGVDIVATRAVARR